MHEYYKSNRFHKGQIVSVRSLKDIIATLDAENKLEGMPFMPEMAQYCGHSFRIACLPVMTCVEGASFRSHSGTVFLENLRCDGSYHDGCQRDCLLFWKEAWLTDQPITQSPTSGDDTADPSKDILKTKQGERYFCQSTELVGATSVYKPDTSLKGKAKKLLSDVWHGEMTIPAFLLKILNVPVNRLKGMLGLDKSGSVTGPHQKTETLSLNLQPGEWVEVKSRQEIEDTLDIHGKNRGLIFDSPMLDECGKQFQVECQIKKIILEETGQMISLNNTVLLQNNICTAWGCPRANRPYWREIWLKRIEPETNRQSKPGN
ncbi:MAG: hypothetical protein P8Z75_13750 [Gammaproteobacteria bacterium]|jgi:hypothetical protein